MNLDEFETLIKRRDEKRREHESACAVLEEEPHPINHKRCVRLYDEIAALQEQIDAELAREAASGI